MLKGLSLITTIETAYGSITAPYDMLCVIADALEHAGLSYRENADVVSPEEAEELLELSEELISLSCEMTKKLIEE